MQPNYKNILYCTDLSENASYAFGHAMALALQSNCKIHILHVVEALSAEAKITIQAFMMTKEARTEALQERSNQAKDFLKKNLDNYFASMGDEAESARKHIESILVIESYPAEQILKTSKKVGADLIVMGAHEKGIKHNFLGSVVKSVLRRSKIPTLIVPLP